jgi:hypothetical protein
MAGIMMDIEIMQNAFRYFVLVQGKAVKAFGNYESACEYAQAFKEGYIHALEKQLKEQ